MNLDRHEFRQALIKLDRHNGTKFDRLKKFWTGIIHKRIYTDRHKKGEIE